jgi:pimeloyl-ACP methyl ester carboxylesterase
MAGATQTWGANGLRWIIRIVAGFFALVAIAVGVVAGLTLEFGERPASSLEPLTTADDVKFIEANGIRFAYLEAGEGPLVLLFHGYPETARSWRVVQQRLAASGYRVIAPYMRGYPPTAFASNGDYAVSALARDVLALIDAFGAQSAIVIGHDWGASAVYAAAAENPAKISRLVALAIPHPKSFAGDPTIFLNAPHFLYYQLPVAERLVWSYDFAHIDWIYDQWAAGDYTPDTAVMADIKTTLRSPDATENVLGYYWSLFNRDPAELEAAARRTISVSTLIIAGAEDGAVSRERYEAARTAFTGPYDYVELAGVGHFPQLEAPDKTADAILTFLHPTR